MKEGEASKMSKDFREYTILVPMMAEPHFTLMVDTLNKSGYNFEILYTGFEQVIDYGLRFVHNDMCYPALIVIGQFIEALSSGRYEGRRIAVLLPQTGGGCRASNYVFLLRKALERSGFRDVPVISLNASGLDDNTLKISPGVLMKLVNALFYGDFIHCLYNQARSYEKKKGDAEKARDRAIAYLTEGSKMLHGFRKNLKKIASFFEEVERDGKNKPKVGIVGEIYLKYSPIGNNHLEDFLVEKGAEPVTSALADFMLYCIQNSIIDARTYNRRRWISPFSRIVIAFAVHREKLMNSIIEKFTSYEKSHTFEDIRKARKGIIDEEVKMGEGWLLSSEIAAYIEEGINNVVIAQPFGCLPNHIVARGVLSNIRAKYPGSNVISVDYDPSASRANQENRINLMLMNAFKNL